MIHLYTIEELKDILKLSAFTIRKKIREKEITAYKSGRRYIIREDDLKKYIDDLTASKKVKYNASESTKNN